MNDISSNVFWGLVGSLLGVVLGLIMKELLAYMKSRRGPLSGEWDQIIENPRTRATKRDRIKCRHIGDRLEGTIRRLEPDTEKYKKWRFRALKRNNFIFGSFWATDLRKNPESYGTLQHYVTTYSLLEGFYVKMKVETTNGESRSSLTEIPFRWERITKR